MTTNTTQNFARAIDNAIDQALRLTLVNTGDSQEQQTPTGSGTYQAIQDVEYREFFECSPSINDWDIEIYRAYLNKKIYLLSIASNAIGNDEQSSQMLEHIKHLQALHKLLGENKGKPFEEYLSPEQQELTRLSESQFKNFKESLQGMAKMYSDAFGYAMTAFKEAKNQAEAQQSSAKNLSLGIV